MAPLINSPPLSHTELTHRPAARSESPLPTPYERPQPRPPKTPAHAAQVRVRNRRREWLTRHPSYFRSLEHELADPVLYDALIRRFQSHEEREKEGRAKGFGRVLEVDLLRGEARLTRLSDDTRRSANGATTGEVSTNGHVPPGAPSRSSSEDQQSAEIEASKAGVDWEELEALEAHDLDKRSAPESAEEGRARWDDFLRLRFIAGRDDDFDYHPVDEDDEYDALERREQEDAWFDNEEPGWAGESDDDEAELDEEGKKVDVERPLTGETGVQDF
ncbi:coiled-coil domain-containing protein-domain-containing protein [Nemania sp. FL0916]|nr:coiled-coil domain-containing protein-domain-containing protein [Nemania sp. FL0916]